MLKQIIDLNSSYAGGLGTYITRARSLLLSSKNGENPLDGWEPSVPTGVTIDPFTESHFQFEAKGKVEIGRCGFILVAGGLGERLGYSGIKIELPAETTTNTCYLALYCRQILSIQTKYAPKKLLLPLAIMVSDDTHSKTIELLERNKYFGLAKEQVHILKQEKVPALVDVDGRIAQLSPYSIDSKPHGHGDIHQLMHTSGVAEKWLNDGILWCVFFQDTNGLGLHALCSLIGVSRSLDLEVNSLAVPRYAKQAVGGIAKLTNAIENREMTVNVEYNQLGPLLSSTGDKRGDVNDSFTGMSPYPGNINQLLFRMQEYCATLRRTQGVIPEFVNPKYADESRIAFKKPTRLECMMQDYPKLLESGAKVGFTLAPAWFCYSPCKNNSTDAAASVKSGVPASAAITAESDQYNIHAEYLRRLGCNVGYGYMHSFLGLSASLSPRIIFDPSFAIFPSDVQTKFPFPNKVFISGESTLIVVGDVVINSLRLDGSLKLVAEPGTKLIVWAGGSVKVTNKGHIVRPVSRTEDSEASIFSDSSHYRDGTVNAEVDNMRGYRIVAVEEKLVRASLQNIDRAFLAKGRRLSDGALREVVYEGKTLVDAEDFVVPKQDSNELACFGVLLKPDPCIIC
jgi:UDP-sugar pyrophosphorylase